MIFVIAGNQSQARSWINQDINKKQQSGRWSYPSEYTYVSNADKLTGYRNPHGVFYGSWRQREDIKEILHALIGCTLTTESSYYTLTKLLRELP